MKVYIAGSSKELDLVARYMDQVRAAGHEITCDWVAAMRQESKLDHELTPDEARMYAERDRRGVATADLFWLLLPKEKSEGAFWELGYTYARTCLGRRPDRIIVSGNVGARIFCRLPEVEVFATHDEALCSFAAPRPTTIDGACLRCDGTGRGRGGRGLLDLSCVVCLGSGRG